jgi:hypothetical protein
VNPILESISNSVSALPAVAVIVQPVSGHGFGQASGQVAPSGFAFSLAAAKAVSTASQEGTASGQASGQVGGNPAGVGTLNVGPLAENLSLKKLSGAAPAVSAAVATNPVVQGLAAAAVNPVLLPPAPVSISLFGVLRASLSQSSLPTTIAVPPGVQIPTVQATTGSASSGVASSGSPSSERPGNIAPTEPAISYYAAARASGFYSATALTGFSLPGTPTGEVLGQTSRAVNSVGIAGSTKPEAVLPRAINLTAGEPQPGIQSAVPAVSPAVEKSNFAGASSSVPAIFSAVATQSIISQSVATQPVQIQPLTNESTVAPAPTIQTPSVETVNAAPILLASTVAASEPVGALAAPVGTPAGPANLSEATPPSAAASEATASESGALQSASVADPLAGIISAQIEAASMPAPAPAGPAAVPVLPGKETVRSTAAAASDTASSPSTRTVGPGAANSLKEAASVPTQSASENGLSAGPTPFSVFFSGAGSGVQSAASALPHLIAPSVNSGLRDSHTFGTLAGSAATPTAAESSSNNNVPQNSSSQNAKESPAASDGTALTAGQTAHRDAELSVAANAPLSSSPSVAAIPTAALTGITVALGAQAAVSGDSLPKPETLPNDASGNPANLTQPLPTPAAAPGPVQIAQMVSRAENSEMRIGMNTTAFGSVEVRTVVHASDVGMTIGSEKGDLRGLLANDLPAITNTLQQQNLRLTGVNFTQGFASANNSSGGGSDSQQRSFAPTRPIADPVLSETAEETSTTLLTVWEAGRGAGLSILA